MLAVYQTKTAIRVVLTSLSVALSYEAKALYQLTPHIPAFIIAIFSFLLTAYFSSLISDAIFKIKWIRKIIIGRSWVEGYWYLKTTEAENIDGLYGIIHYSYIGKAMDLSATAYHLSKDLKETRTQSQLIEFRDSDLLYVNIFLRSVSARQVTGVAVGHFVTDDASTIYPVSYDGRITFFDDIATQHQFGSKIPDSEVKTYSKQYKQEWKKHILINYQKEKTT